MNSLHNVQMHTWKGMSVHPSIDPCYKPRSAEWIFITFHVYPMTLYRTPQRFYCKTTSNVWQTQTTEGCKTSTTHFRIL